MIQDILRKLAKDLPDHEQKALINWAVNVDGSFGARRGPYSWRIQDLTVGKLTPEATLLFPFVAEKTYHGTDTPVTDDTFTVVTFNQNKYGNNEAFKLDDDNERIFINTRAKSFYVGLAHAWEPSATGRRRADFQYFDEEDNLIGTALISVEQGFPGDENWFAPARIADLPDHVAYMKCRVKQTSGGDLNLVYFALDLHVV